MKITTIYFPNEDEYTAISDLAYRERKTVSEIAREALAEWRKKHGDGNPSFTLDQFQDSNFKACPAFFRDRYVWINYLNSLDEKQFKEFDTQLNILLNLGNKRFDSL